MLNNPLLDFASHPAFDCIEVSHITPAIDSLLTQARTVIAQLEKLERITWNNFVEPLTDVTEPLSYAWGLVAHLHAVMNSAPLNEAYLANLPKITDFGSELGQNLVLYSHFKTLLTQAEYADYSPARKKVIENQLRGFKLSGAQLDPPQKARLSANSTRMAELSARFEQNVLDATDAFALYLDDREQLAGVPADVCEQLAAAAKEDGRATAYKLTLKRPCYLPIMQYASSPSLRQTLYDAYVTLASELGDSQFDNSPIIRETLVLAQENATLLGFADYAEQSLYTKMARDTDEVLDFLTDLAKHARPFALNDRTQLEDFAKTQLGLPSLAAWDLAYVSEKLRVECYAFSEQEVKQFFPLERVLAGLFKLVSQLFGVNVHTADAQSWHHDVRYFEIWRGQELIGAFYLDLYARASKRAGAWMDGLRSRRRRQDKLQIPLAVLVCNFSAPLADKAVLLTHDEVITLFHEFGHGLHHVLTQVDEPDVAGIHGVEWDAVELPSQFMENFCWEERVLQNISQHIVTHQPIDQALCHKMWAAKNFQSGLQTLRQIEFSLFDILLYSRFDAKEGDWQALLDQVRQKVAVFTPPAYNRFPNSFTHIFAGGYSAGYYSYKWAEVLAADAYAAFEEQPEAYSQIGACFWQEILAVGGSRPALDSFCAFRGRKPNHDAYLRHAGMVGDKV